MPAFLVPCKKPSVVLFHISSKITVPPKANPAILPRGAVTGAEVPHLRLRGKTSVVVYITHIVCDFAVTFSLPYLMDARYANLQSKVGFIYGSAAIVGVVWAYFFLPEMRYRSLEELEDMWHAKVPARKFRCKSRRCLPLPREIDCSLFL